MVSHADGDADGGDAVRAPHGELSGEEAIQRTHLRVLPPAANWYCSQVCDWGYDARNGRWLVVYGAKNGLCIFEFNVSDPSAAQRKPHAKSLEQTLRRPLRTNFVALLSRGKKDGRVTAVRCLRDAEGELRVVCAGEEGAVQIWDPVSLARVDQHRKHGNAEVTALGIRAELDPNWVVAGDKNGCISVWQRDTSMLHSFAPVSGDAVFSTDMSPRDKRLVAVGYRSGALCIVDVVEKSVRYRLDGHDLEVQAVVWAPRSDVTAVQYLATASRDRTIKVWAFNTADESASEPSLVARLEVRKPQQASSHSQSTRLWLPLAWTTGSTEGRKYGLWSGSFEGNLQLWQWNGVPRGTIKPSLVLKNGHNRLLFGIVPLHASQTQAPTAESDSRSQLPLLATISLDRDIRVWSENLDASPAGITCIERIPAQGGFTYSLDFNPSRKLLACGVGDQTIRLWNLSGKQDAGGYPSELVWKGLQSKVTCVQWHPMQDHVLAFGTEDGRIGLWDLRTKSSQRLKVNHPGEIRDLVWSVHSPSAAVVDAADGDDAFKQAMKALEQAQAQGQNLEEAIKQQEDGRRGSQNGAHEVVVYLWSVDRSGVLRRTDVEKQTTAEVRKDCLSFSWDSSFTALAVGVSSGKVEIFAMPAFASSTQSAATLSLSVVVHEHKDAVSAVAWSSGTNGARQLLASGAKNGDIFIYEGLMPTSALSCEVDSIPGYGQNVTAVFKGHSGAVNSLRWSSVDQGSVLASCSDDGTAKVWDVRARTLLSSFNLHASRVFTTSWITPTIVASGGQDQSIRVWDYTAHPVLAGEDIPREIKKPPTPRRENAQPVEKQLTIVGSSTSSQSSSSRKARVKKNSATNDSVFSSKSGCWEQRDQSNHVVEGWEGAPATSVWQQNRSYVASERVQLEQDEKWDQAAQVYLLEGRIADALQLVAQHGALSAAWVSYAPMAGLDVWREISILYARQLHSAGEFKNAAFQYLTVGKVESAVQCFVDGSMYPEAISLVIARLGPSHELLHKIQWQYAQKLEKKKEIDEAASMYLSINSVEARIRAVTILGASGIIKNARRAMAAWLDVREESNGSKMPTDTSDARDQVTLPTSMLLSILGLALTHRDWALASQAVNGLLHGTSSVAVPSSVSQAALYRLSLCALGIAAALEDRDGNTTLTEHPSMLHVLHGSESEIVEARQFIDALRAPGILPWNSDVDTETDAANLKSAHFWCTALQTCRKNGLWFHGSELAPDEVVEILADRELMDYMMAHVPQGDPEDAKITEAIKISRLILKFLAELMSGYLLSALEAVREFLSSLVASRHDYLHVLQLLLPGGIIDFSAPPAVGELGVEADDTASLWRDSFLYQCELATRMARSSSDAATRLKQLQIIVDLAAETSIASETTDSHLLRVRQQLEMASRVSDPDQDQQP